MFLRQGLGAAFFGRKATADARLGQTRLPLALLIVGAAATCDELAQAFFPSRTFDLGDLFANLAGVVVLGSLAGLGRGARLAPGEPAVAPKPDA